MRESVMFIPMKLAFSLNKANSHPIVSKILQENPQAFNNSSQKSGDANPLNHDALALSLILYLLYEMTLEKSSYWYPYLMSIQICRSTFHWDKKYLAEMQD